jgi:pyruvate dehydrogenase E2 component (dihydrolipoamide acetyltransferase)
LADVVMPQLGETVTEGTVTKWLKAVGETIARDEPLFEVSTDKVDSEVPSPAGGVLSEIRVQEGDTVDVGTVLAVVSDGAAAPAAPPVDTAAAVPAPPAPAPVAEAPPPPPPPSPVVPPAPAVPPVPEVPAAPAPAPAPVPVPVPAPVATGAPADANGNSGVANRVLSPVVRRLLDEHGLDPSEIRGTGLGGRITRSDVLALIDEQRSGAAAPAASPADVAPPPAADTPPTPIAAAPAPATASAPAPAPAAAAPAAAPVVAAPAAAPVPAPAPAAARPEAPAARAGTDELVPFTNIRRRTAEHMVRSKATSPHTLVVLEADYENVERVRRARGTQFREEEGFSLSYLPFIARATVEALHEWVDLNSSVGEDALIVHHQVNLGIAVDLDHQGLIVPVVPRAEELTLRGLARRIHDLATRARTKKLTADDISGGTFSITNAGPFGTFLTAPIINQPQVAILSTDGVKRRPVVVTGDDGTEAIAIHSIGLLCLSWDHRAVDGAYAAAFVARIAELLDTHDWAAEL